MKNIFLIPLLFFLFVACDKDEPMALGPSSENFNFNPLDTIHSVGIISNAMWTAKSNASWCIISDSVGSGNINIAIQCQHNLTTVSRQTTILIKAGSISRYIIVKQNSGVLIAKEEFTDNTALWPVMNRDTLTTNVINGFFNIKNATQRSIWYLTRSYPLNYSGDFQITTKYKAVSGTMPFGIVFGYKDILNFYRVLVYPWGGCVVVKNQDNTYSTLLNQRINYTSETEIRLLKIGIQCEVYINESKIGSFEVTTPSGGNVGFTSCSQTEVNVDYLRAIQF